MVDDKIGSVSETKNAAAGAAKTGVRGYLAGGAIGGALGLGGAVALGHAMKKSETGWVRGLGTAVQWLGGGYGAMSGAAAGATLGATVGVIDGASDGLQNAQAQNATMLTRQQDIEQKSIENNAQMAFEAGRQQGVQSVIAHIQEQQQAAAAAANEAQASGFAASVQPRSPLSRVAAPAESKAAAAEASKEAANAAGIGGPGC